MYLVDLLAESTNVVYMICTFYVRISEARRLRLFDTFGGAGGIVMTLKGSF